ncbi:MAG: murein biosynthesis integral membrane protein MurJ [Pseudomonadota bacterium]
MADAFFVAFRFPNLFRRLFGEGAFNAAFIPLFAKKLEGEGPRTARAFAQDALAGLLFVLLLVTAVCEMAMPWLMVVIAPGFADDTEKFDLAVLLTRIAFPYLLCMSLVALLSGVLNALGRFFMAAAAPVALNIVLIGVMVIALAAGFANEREAGILLAWGVALAGFVQLIMLAIAAFRADMGLGLSRPRLTDDMRQLVRLGVPGVIAGGTTQINIVVGTMIASLQAGAVSYLYYADRLAQLPLGIVGIAIGVVLLPDLARKLRAGDTQAASESQNRSLEFALLLTLPATVALAVAAHPLIQVLFERGAFTAEATPATALALIATAAGLPAFVLIKVFSPAFFAREDTRTPMRFAVVSMLVNIAGSLALFFGFRALGFQPHVGIAIAGSVAGWINASLLGITLARDGRLAPDARLWRAIPLIVLASGVMGLVLWALAAALGTAFAPTQGWLIQWGALAVLVAGGLAAYAILIALTGVMTPRALKAAMAGR